MTDMELAEEKEIFEILHTLVRRCRILNDQASAKEMSKCAAIIAALRRVPERPPSGEMVMVPREPTPKMFEAGWKALNPKPYLTDLGEAYRAMLSACEEKK